jgi:hypothetical protein
MCYLCEDKKRLRKEIDKRNDLIKEFIPLLRTLLNYNISGVELPACYTEDVRLLLEKAKGVLQ